MSSSVIFAQPLQNSVRSSSSRTLTGTGDRIAPPRPAAGRRAEPSAADAAPRGTGVAPAASFASGDVIGGRYHLEDRTAEGGMGEVWTAFDQKLGREVVVKRMNADLLGDEVSRKRFEQEAQVVASVTSPHVVEFLDYGVEEGVPYIVLERLVGDDLEQRLRRGRLRPEQVVALAEQLASALTAAHARGVVHRDIKPANIFLARHGDGPDARQIVKLLDFGVAKLRGSQLRTGDGLTVGSPEFMSPEQVEGGRGIDGRSDLFSLASVLYTSLTGRMPFAGTDFLDTVYLILAGEFVPATELRPSLPPAVDDFFTIALATDPEERFSTPSAMAAAFRAAVSRPRTSTPPKPRRAEPVKLPSWPVREVTPQVGGAPSIDPPALQSFGSRTRAALRAHLVAPLAKPREADLRPRLDRKNILFLAAALLAVSGTATALWQWSHEKSAFERGPAAEIPAAGDIEY